ncbi:MAG: hypothetical protein GDA46_07280 [Bdellovibrionales bacterium]|nr:hypothetical protein [Bdellovibrionales bacterium]
MSKNTKTIKYRDLPWDLRNQVDFTYGHIQKAQNPTIKHIVNRLKKFEKTYLEEGANVSAKEKREAIKQLEDYMYSVDLSS